MEMPLKPNILDDIEKDVSVSRERPDATQDSYIFCQDWIPAPPPVDTYYSDDDIIVLEDDSGRMKLGGDIIKKAGIVSGVVVAVLGMETDAGEFEVVDFCFPELPMQKSLVTEPNAMDVDGTRGPGVKLAME